MPIPALVATGCRYRRSYYRGLPCRHSRASVRPRPVGRSDIPISSGQGTSPRPAWRRAPRTKAALATKVLAVEQAVRVLEEREFPIPSRCSASWSSSLRRRFRAARPSRSGPRGSVSGSVGGQRRDSRDIPALEQALADQGHRIPGYVSRPARLSKSPRLSKEERLRARREADLAEMEHAHAQLMASLREMTEDLIAGRRIRRRDPRSARAKRLFTARLELNVQLVSLFSPSTLH